MKYSLLQYYLTLSYFVNPLLLFYLVLCLQSQQTELAASLFTLLPLSQRFSVYSPSPRRWVYGDQLSD